MTSEITGLTLFIKRIRACTSPQQEQKEVENELAKIRSYFANKSLSTYDRKKCAWKLVYISVLGYEIDMGHGEVLLLINSNAFSEKIAGYMAMTLLFDEQILEKHDYILNVIRKDLQGGNELHQSMALCAITNFAARAFAEKFSTIIAKIAFGETGNTYYVQKRALLCLTTFLKKNPSIYQEQWSTFYRSLFSHLSIGVLMAACAYFSVCGEKFGPEHLLPIADVIVGLLSKLVDTPMAFAMDYRYHDVMCPWLQVKLLKILQILPAPVKESTLNAVNTLLNNIVTRVEISSSVYKNNAEHSILFEAINVISHYGKAASIKVKNNVLAILNKYISVREPNIRYLALEALSKMENSPETCKLVMDKKDNILISLRDRDLSIRRRALDVLFTLCCKESANAIVADLLDYLKEKDIHLKDELVLKIALLAENFGTDLSWYIDVIMKILELAGNSVADYVWIRISQIVTGFENESENSTELQRYATQKVFNALNTANSSEPLIKLGAYLLGEYGGLMNDNSAKNMQKQFELLKRHYLSCSQIGRCMILSAFTKFVTKMPEMKESVQEFIEAAQTHWDLDTQQRANEYLAMMNSEKFKEKKDEIIEKLPPYPEQFLYNNVVLKSLENIKKERTSESELNLKNQRALMHSKTLPAGQVPTPLPKPQVVKAAVPLRKDVEKALQEDVKTAQPQVKKSLIDLDDNELPKRTREELKRYDTMSVGTIAKLHEFYTKFPHKFAEMPSVDPSKAQKLVVPSENAELWKKCISRNVSEGIIFENDIIKVAIKSMYQKFMGRLILQFINKRERFENVLVELQSPPQLEATCSKVKYAENPMVMIRMMLAGAFDVPPILTVSFLMGGAQERVRFALPVLMSKFIEPIELPLSKFEEVWKDITINKPNTFEKMDTIMKNPAPAHLSHMDVLKRMAQLFSEYFGFRVIPPVDLANFSEMCAIGQIPFKPADQAQFPNTPEEMRPPMIVPVYAQVEFYPQILKTEFRFSIRVSDQMPVTCPILSLFKFFVNPTT